MLLEISGEITPERMKGWSHSKNNIQLWMWLVMEVQSNAVKNNITWKPEMLGPWIKGNWKWSNRGSWTWTVLWRPIRPFRTNTQKRCPFHFRELKCKSRKSRNTWNNMQIWPWNTEWSRAKTNTVLPRERTGNSKHPLPTTQEKTLHMDITRCSTPKSDWLYFLQPKMEKLNKVSKNKTRSWLWLRPWTPYCQIQT